MCQHGSEMHRKAQLSAGTRVRCCLAAARPALRELAALALWHAANWLREALNAFAGDPPMATCAQFLPLLFRWYSVEEITFLLLDSLIF